MKLADDVLGSLPEAQVLEVRIGSHWSAVVIEGDAGRRCGLAATLKGIKPGPDVPLAGKLDTVSAGELASEIRSPKPVMRTVGTATINALLSPGNASGEEYNAEQVIREQGMYKRVAVVGRFPFVKRLKAEIDQLVVIEREPEQDEMPESSAPVVLGKSEVIAITGMAFTNGSLEGLLRYCPPEALVMVVGASTPLSPILFNYGVDLLAGAVVIHPEQVLQTLSQGGNFRQIHQAGVRLITLDSASSSSKM